ncbi:MAG: GMP/IMP nucleotidase [Acidiferrobacterales bacterium]|nr:GMP/IMP nucleotidase [Acidiferrobacterales bacterium]
MTIQIDWQNIDTILLDMDGTLLDLHFDNYFWRQHLPTVYAQQNQLSFGQAMAIFEPMFEKYAGSLNWYCVNFWSEQLGVDIMQLKQEVANKISYRPDAELFLHYCREKVSDLRLITNAHRDVLNLKIQHTQLDQYFDSMLCSHELDAPKEDQRFWQNLQTKQGFDPNRSIFIDDSEAVLDAAAQYGIANIMSISNPDSQNVRTTESKYQMIDSFRYLNGVAG